MIDDAKTKTKRKNTKKKKQTDKRHKTTNRTSAEKHIKEKISGCEIWLSPPCIIGSKTNFIENDDQYRYSSSELKKILLNFKIGDRKITVSKEGHIFVESVDKSDAARIFNVIIALAFLKGIFFFAAREQELLFLEYSKDDPNIIDATWTGHTLHTSFNDYNRPNEFKYGLRIHEIPPQKLRSIIKKAFKVICDQKLAENLRLFTESFSHITNGEYAQSFIMSWSVIERKYSDMWKMILDKRDLDRDRYKKLTNSGQWTFDHILESLNLNDAISDYEYDRLIDLKRKRNKLYHGGKTISKEDACTCLQFAEDILKKEINPDTY